jgi:anti-anti-sigma factor
MTSSKYVRMEEQEDILLVVPLFTFGRFAEADLWEQWRDLQQKLKHPALKNVVFDLDEIPYFGSTVLDWMVHLWKQAKSKGGSLAVCNCSAIGKEVLAAARFNTLWGIYDSRELAIAALQNSSAENVEAEPSAGGAIANSATAQAADPADVA